MLNLSQVDLGENELNPVKNCDSNQVVNGESNQVVTDKSN